MFTRDIENKPSMLQTFFRRPVMEIRFVEGAVTNLQFVFTTGLRLLISSFAV